MEIGASPRPLLPKPRGTLILNGGGSGGGSGGGGGELLPVVESGWVDPFTGSGTVWFRWGIDQYERAYFDPDGAVDHSEAGMVLMGGDGRVYADFLTVL